MRTSRIPTCPICGVNEATVETEELGFRDTDVYMKFYEQDATEEDEERYRDMERLFKNGQKIFKQTKLYPCQTCNEQLADKLVKLKSKEQATRKRDKLISCGLGTLYHDASLSNCPEWIQDYLDNSLFLHGHVGTGKTYIAAALLRYDLSKQRATYFTSVQNLILKVKSTFNDIGESEYEAIRFYSTVDNLYLDDIGTEKLTEWVVTLLCTIIDNRSSNMLRTVITSNLNIKDLSVQLGDRITSRIVGLCGKPKSLRGEDRRLMN